jgi:erythronate-4-phosphate dehydrogenase
MKLLYDRNMELGDELFPRLGDAQAIDGRTLTAQAVKEADLLFVRSTCKVNADLLEGSNVRFVGSGVVGTDHIDHAAMQRLAIAYAAAPGCNAESVANYVIAALLVIGERQGRLWEGATLGVVGVGHVGSIVCRFAREALGMKVLCCDPPRQANPFDREAQTFISYEALLSQADVITFHTPLTREGPYPTYGLFSGPIVRNVKPGAVLLNFARGPICDNALLATMLGAGYLSDAAIDCWEGEPDYSPDLAAVACLTTPHIAGHAYEGKANGTWMVYQRACEMLGLEPGEKPAYPPATVAKVTIDAAKYPHDDALLRAIVKKTCDIEGDTQRFRQAFDAQVERRKANFDALRKNYPFRRHFDATVVTIKHGTPRQLQKLAALGFQVHVSLPRATKATTKKAPVKKPASKAKPTKKQSPRKK